MAITTSICTSLKSELLSKLHNFASGGDTFKMALFIGTPAGTFGAGTTNYSNMGTDELTTAGGYTAGGQSMANNSVTIPSVTARADFSNVSWAAATFSTRGVLMYNSSSGNRAVAVWDFGGVQAVAAQTFLIQMPAVGDSTSLIRIA